MYWKNVKKKENTCKVIRLHYSAFHGLEMHAENSFTGNDRF